MWKHTSINVKLIDLKLGHKKCKKLLALNMNGRVIHMIDRLQLRHLNKQIRYSLRKHRFPNWSVKDILLSILSIFHLFDKHYSQPRKECIVMNQ